MVNRQFPEMTRTFIDHGLRIGQGPELQRGDPEYRTYQAFSDDCRVYEFEDYLSEKILVRNFPKVTEKGFSRHFPLPLVLEGLMQKRRNQFMQQYPREIVAQHIEDMYGRICVSEVRFRVMHATYGAFKGLFEEDFRLAHFGDTTNYNSFQEQLIAAVIQIRTKRLDSWKLDWSIKVANQINQHYIMPIGEEKALGIYHKLQENQYRKIGLNDDILDVIKSFLVPKSHEFIMPPWNMVDRPEFRTTHDNIVLPDGYMTNTAACFSPHLAMIDTRVQLGLDSV
jgi:hypothetical protein